MIYKIKTAKLSANCKLQANRQTYAATWQIANSNEEDNSVYYQITLVLVICSLSATKRIRR